jgi:hypothetical protein
MLELLNYNINDGVYFPEYTGSYQSIFSFTSNLGDFSSTGDIAHDQFSSVLDGNPVVRTYNNFTINAGHTVTPTNRCKGMYLNILGDLTVNGTLSMTARGANAEGQYIIIDKLSKFIYFSNNQPSDIVLTQNPNQFCIINKIGGAAVLVINGLANPGINGACGSGGCGFVEFSSKPMGLGGAGTSFSGGAGGGAKIGRANLTSQNGSSIGGAGGNGITDSGSYSAGGGAGNPGGTSNAGATGSSGTGGLMILFVQGNIIFGANGSIQSNGSKGGNSYGSGGGSGGGAIHLFHRGTINTPSKITATGGPAGTGTGNGTAGGKGTVNLQLL